MVDSRAPVAGPHERVRVKGSFKRALLDLKGSDP